MLEGAIDADLWHSVRHLVRREVDLRDRRTRPVELAWTLSSQLQLLFHAWDTAPVIDPDGQLAHGARSWRI